MDNLELTVLDSKTGILETNISQLELFVNEKLKEYTPEKFVGDAETAKKKRAELNTSKKVIAQKRIQIINELMKPYQDFELRCKALESKIDEMSKSLDQIVKEKEQKEKHQKRVRIQELFNTFSCSVITLEKIFNEKWLNKTTKEKDILSEMEQRINKVYTDLKIIEKYGTSDVEVMKAHYLDCMNIEDTLAYGEELEKNRKKVQEELAEREQKEQIVYMKKQEEIVRQEQIDLVKREEMNDIINDALGFSNEPVVTEKEYVISLKTNEEKLLKLKYAMNALGLRYNVEEIKF